MYVNTSSSGPIVTFVITGALSCPSVTLYGLVPPVMLSPHGWQVCKFCVTFAVTTGVEDVGAGMRQEVSPPADAAVEAQRAFSTSRRADDARARALRTDDVEELRGKPRCAPVRVHDGEQKLGIWHRLVKRLTLVRDHRSLP